MFDPHIANHCKSTELIGLISPAAMPFLELRTTAAGTMRPMMMHVTMISRMMDAVEYVMVMSPSWNCGSVSYRPTLL